MDNHQFTFKARWCGNCHHIYAVQLDRREGTFVSAQAHLRGGEHSMVIVTHCVECNVPLDQAWLDECLTAAPEAKVYRGGE